MALLRDVTIIIPVFVRTVEQLQWVDECVASAVKQRCKVLLLDDGSPVDVRERLAKYANQTELLVSKKNRGVAAARNLAVRHVSTELILPLDCDDVLQTGAVATMLQAWRGIPVYSDLEMFGDRIVPHYELREFSCERLAKAVGLAPVTVLHSKEQWEKIGGWNEQLPLYEDGEYNARLMSEYCAVHISKPLLRYRQHNSQRSRKQNASTLARQVHRQYITKESIMARGCCGRGSKSSPSSSIQTVKTQGGQPLMFHNTTISQPTALPGADEERVRARYLGGKGQGPHYYKGRVTGFRYKVVHGAEVSVDARDAVYSEDQVGIGSSLFLALEQPKTEKLKEVAAATPMFHKEAAAEAGEERTARQATAEKEPVAPEADENVTVDVDYEEEEEEDYEPEIPNVYHMTVREIEALEVSPEVAEELLRMEKRGKNRTGAKDALQKLIEG